MPRGVCLSGQEGLSGRRGSQEDTSPSSAAPAKCDPGKGLCPAACSPAAPAALPLAGRLSLLLASLNAAQGRPVRFWARAATVFRTGPRCRRCPGSGGEGLDAF